MPNHIRRRLCRTRRHLAHGSHANDPQPLQTLDPPVSVQHRAECERADRMVPALRALLDRLPDFIVAGDIGAREQLGGGVVLQLVRLHEAAQLLVSVQYGRLVSRSAPVIGVDERRVAVVGGCEAQVALGFGLHDGRKRGEDTDVGCVAKERRRGVLVNHLWAIRGQTGMKGAFALEHGIREAQRTENVAIIGAQQATAVVRVELALNGDLSRIIMPLPDSIYA